jgi:hypothetical protein
VGASFKSGHFHEDGFQRLVLQNGFFLTDTHDAPVIEDADGFT